MSLFDDNGDGDDDKSTRKRPRESEPPDDAAAPFAPLTPQERAVARGDPRALFRLALARCANDDDATVADVASGDGQGRPPSVGARLLAGMGRGLRPHAAQPARGGGGGGGVAQYVPEAIGGFIATGAAALQPHSVVVGAILCHERPDVAPAVATAESHRVGAAPRFLSDVATSSGSAAAAATAEAEEVRCFGRTRAAAARELVRVTAVDRAARRLEAQLVDGTCLLLDFAQCRAAGPVDRSLFAELERTAAAAAVAKPGASADARAAAGPMWPMPRMVVRAANELLAPDVFRRKFVVVATLPKERRVALAPWSESPAAASTVVAAAAAAMTATLELAVEDLQTVVPRKGGRGIVLGAGQPRQFEMVVVRGGRGGLGGVRVAADDGAEFDLDPESICLVV